MSCVEFKLTMPGRGSWNGGWSGTDRNYTRIREIDAAQAQKLDGRCWSYRWSDGWCAQVAAQIIDENDERPPSHGFGGYDWMITSILLYDNIYADHEKPEASS